MGLEGSKKAEGYTVAIPFTKRAKIAFYISLALLLLGAVWLGRKGVASLQGKVVRGAEISLLSDKPLDAKEQLARTWRWALNAPTKRTFDELELKVLAIESPEKALVRYREYMESGEWSQERMNAYADLMLDTLSVAVKAQDWDYVATELANFETRFPERLNDSRVLALQAWQAIRKGSLKEGSALIQSALKINPYEVEALMLRSRFQVASASEIEKTQARATFKKIAAGSDVDSLEALLLLLVSKDMLLFPEDWEFALEALRSHPYESIHFSLQNADLLRQLTAVLVYKDVDLCIKYLDRLTAKPEAVAGDWVRLAYALQLNDAVERSAEVIAKVDSMGANPDLVLWLKGRQAYLLQDWETALNVLSEGSRGKMPQPFFESLVGFITDDDEEIPAGIRLQAARVLRGWTTADFDHWLLIRRELWARDEAARESILQECQEKAAAGNSIRMARFLLTLNEPAAALALIDEFSSERETDETFGLRFDALLKLDRFDEVAGLIEASEKVNAFVIELAKLQLAFEVRDDVAMERAWTASSEFSAAEGLAGDGYLRMARLAVAYNQPLLAEHAFDRQFSKDVDKRGGTLELWTQYFNIALNHAQTEKALKIAYFAVEEFPGSEEMRFQVAYLNLLLQRGVLTAKDSLKALIEKRPGKVAYQYGLALALLRTELGLEASLTIADFDAREDGTLSTLELIVEFACLVEQSRWEEATAMRKEIDLNAMLPEEAAFVLKYEKRMRGGIR